MGIMMVVGHATSLTSGRMRYAPTLVRSFHGYNDGCWTCYFAAVRAYALAPLHLLGDFMGILMVVGHATSPP